VTVDFYQAWELKVPLEMSLGRLSHKKCVDRWWSLSIGNLLEKISATTLGGGGTG